MLQILRKRPRKTSWLTTCATTYYSLVLSLTQPSRMRTSDSYDMPAWQTSLQQVLDAAHENKFVQVATVSTTDLAWSLVQCENLLAVVRACLEVWVPHTQARSQI